MPLSNKGDVVNQTKVKWGQSYTNGKYTIHDPHDLKQRSRKRSCQSGTCPPSGTTAFSFYKDWSVKMVSMSANITSLKVIWKHVSHLFSRPFPAASFFHPFFHCSHLTFRRLALFSQPAITQSDRKLASEQILRKLLASLNASSTSRPQIDVVSALLSR